MMPRIRVIAFLVTLVAVVMGLVFLSSTPSAWATPNQSPQAQTVPTPGPTATPIPVATPAATPAPPSGGSTGRIDFSEGGSVAAPDNEVVVTVPAAAIPQSSIDLAYAPMDVADVPAAPGAGFSFLGRAFTLQAFVSGAAQDTYTFQRSITITVNVTAADIAAAGGIQNIVIQRYDEALGAWVNLPTNFDLVAQTVSATVRSLSWFALAAPAPEATATPTPTPVLVPGDIYLSGSSGWWLGLAVLGLFLVLLGGLALRRTATKRS